MTPLPTHLSRSKISEVALLLWIHCIVALLVVNEVRNKTCSGIQGNFHDASRKSESAHAELIRTLPILS
jgi:hypothetical protein